MTEQAKENLKKAEVYRPDLRRTHQLKTWPEFYGPLVRGDKTFELRRNDRDYKPGDLIVAEEFEPSTGTYTGSRATFIITYVLENTNYLQPGMAALAVRRL